MEFVAREIDIGSRNPMVILNGEDAEELGVNPLDRVQIRHDDRTVIGIVEVTEELVPVGSLGVTRRLGHVQGYVDVTVAPRPTAVHYIRKKLEDVELERDEIASIVREINENRLNDVELGAYVCGAYTNGLSMAETTALAESMAEVGETLDWQAAVVGDKHSIGGVPGNRVTPVVVPIVAAADVTIPKTSSRAVTSPAGTADTMEVFCEVEFELAEIREIVEKTGGCMVWGGSVSLSPVDDKIIRVENPLSIDPPGQIIASVLSKKKAAGSTHVVIDLPYGEGAKIDDLSAARELAEDFKRVGDHLGLELACTITRGTQPIGRGIGPVLEARDVLAVLDGADPRELRLKSVRIANVLLELCGVEPTAAEILDSGRALAKFREIVAAQRGDPDVERADLVPGGEIHTVTADREGVVVQVDNGLVSDVARRAGAPRDRRAGIYLHRQVGEAVARVDDLFTIHAEKASKLADATALVERTEPVRVRTGEEALVERV